MDNKKEKSFSNISVRSFIMVIALLSVIIIVSGALSYFIPQGSFDMDDSGAIIPGSYQQGEVKGIAIWRVITAPIRVFAGDDSLTIIMISLFLLIMSGVFNVLDKTNGIRVFIGRLMRRLADKGGPVVCVCVLVFMLFGSFFGMFEELCTLIPLMVVLMLSLNMDTMTGLGACMLAACFGFSAAITNPFSVGIASQYAGVETSSGVWLRIVFFVLVYVTTIAFLMLYLRKIEKNPKASLTYESDSLRRQTLQEAMTESADQSKTVKVYGTFFAVQGVILIAIASIRAISGLAIPILAASFLILGLAAGFIVSRSPKTVLRQFFQGAAAMLPAVVMIAIASSAKLVMEESGIIDTIMHFVLQLLMGKGKFVAIVLIYFLIIFLQLFIGSASAKIVLVMPIIMPIAKALGISPSLVILTYCMADGFSDVIIPTNPVLLIGLSMANVSYLKWVKWTWKLQLLIFLLSMLVLFFGVSIQY